MDKVLIIGCNKVTEVIVPILAGVGSQIKELCIAGPDKAQCDEYRKYAVPGKIRILTAGVDLKNEERTKMMMNIFGPQMIVYLDEPSLAMTAMQYALDMNAHYIDKNLLYNDINDTFVAKQFERYSDFRDKNLTAITGCGFAPSVIMSIVRSALDYEFDKIDSLDLFDAAGEENDDNNDDLMNEISKLSTDASVVQNGELMTFSPLECKTSLDVEDVGMQDYFIFNHSIVNSFMKEMPEISNVRFFSTFNTRNLNLISTLKSVGLLDKTPIEVNGAKISPYEFLSAMFGMNLVKGTSSDEEAKSQESDATSGVISLILSGTKSGEEKTLRYTIESDIRGTLDVSTVDYLSGIAIASAIKFMNNGSWIKAGVYAPSRFDNTQFINNLRENGLVIKTNECEEVRLIGEKNVVSKLGKSTSSEASGVEVKVG